MSKRLISFPFFLDKRKGFLCPHVQYQDKNEDFLEIVHYLMQKPLKSKLNLKLSVTNLYDPHTSLLDKIAQLSGICLSGTILNYIDLVCWAKLAQTINNNILHPYPLVPSLLPSNNKELYINQTHVPSKW